MEITPEQLDRLKVMQEELWRITQEQGTPFQLDELRQRMRWLIEEIENEESQP